MPNQLIKIIIATLLFLFSHSLWAGEIESELKAMEAQLIYEDAVKRVVDEEYDKALRRLDWVISAYPETAYGQLATDKKREIALLLGQTKSISGMSRAGLVGFGTLFTTWLGVGTLILLDIEEEAPYGLVLIAGPLSGLIGSLSLTQDSELSDGQASLINLGGLGASGKRLGQQHSPMPVENRPWVRAWRAVSLDRHWLAALSKIETSALVMQR